MPLLHSTKMQKAIDKVMGAQQSQLLSIECTFTSTVNENYSFKPIWIERLSIVQDFMAQYMDFVFLQLTMTPAEYHAMYLNNKDLECKLIVKTVDRGGNIIETVDEKDYIVLMREKRDISKLYSSGELQSGENMPETEAHHSNRINVELDMWDRKAYYARKKQMNFILRDGTVADAIISMCGMVNMENIFFPPPDNSVKYANMIIPPTMQLHEALHFLQDNPVYGVYDSGLCHYISNDILYIWPRFDTEPDTDNVVNIYNAGEGAYAGELSFHLIESDTTHVVCNTEVTDQETVDEVLENLGTSFMLLHSDRLIDAHRTAAEEEFTIEANVENVHVDTDEGMMRGTYSPKFDFTENLHRFKSAIVGAHTSNISAGWKLAVPFTFKPGHRVYFHYDDVNGEYKKLAGVCQHVTYSIERAENAGTPQYTCVAQMQLTTHQLRIPK